MRFFMIEFERKENSMGNEAPAQQIVLYGTAWCGDCWRATQVFKRLNVPYQYVDIDQDVDAAEWVQQLN